jgi:hypothetical protein
MKDKLMLKLKKKMEAGAKAIDLGNKSIEAIKNIQEKVVEDFNATVMATVRKSESQIAYHEDLIKQAEGMSL